MYVSPGRNRVCHFICRSVAAECVTASKVSGRYESPLRATVVSETMGCPSRGHWRPLRDYVSGSPVRTPCRRSLSVIDERHFCNDSPTCDFRCLGGEEERERESVGGGTNEDAGNVAETFKRRATDV